jgi:hypothetical protein
MNYAVLLPHGTKEDSGAVPHWQSCDELLFLFFLTQVVACHDRVFI